MIRVGSEYTLRCIQRTGGGIQRYEIGPEKSQVVGVSSANSLFCSLVENAAPRVNSGTHYRIVGPDSTYQFSGDKKAWPVYVTISNILARTRNNPVKMPILLLALLPVLPKFTGESARADEAQWEMNADVL